MDVPNAVNNGTNAPRSNISGNMNVDSSTTLPASSSAVSTAVTEDHQHHQHHQHQQHEVGKLIIHEETPITTTTKKPFSSFNPPAFTATASSSSTTRNDNEEQFAVSESDDTATAAADAVVGTTGTTKPSRWRFVNNKARTRSAKYTEPPDVSLYDYDTNNTNTNPNSRYKKETPVRPEQTVYQYPFAFKEVKKKKEKEVGKLDIEMTLPNVFQTSKHHEVGKLTIHEVEQEVEELPTGTFEGLLLPAPSPFESTPPEDDDGVVTRKPFREWNTGNTNNTIELTPKKQEQRTMSEWYDNGHSNDSYKIMPDSINNNNNKNKDDNTNNNQSQSKKTHEEEEMGTLKRSHDPDEYMDIFFGGGEKNSNKTISSNNNRRESDGSYGVDGCREPEGSYYGVDRYDDYYYGGDDNEVRKRKEEEEGAKLLLFATRDGSTSTSTSCENGGGGGGSNKVLFARDIDGSSFNSTSTSTSSPDNGGSDGISSLISRSSSSSKMDVYYDRSTQTEPPIEKKDNDNKKKKRWCLYLLLILLLVLVIVLAVLLGQKNHNREGANVAVGASNAGTVVFVPPVLLFANETNKTNATTALPSSYPSVFFDSVHEQQQPLTSQSTTMTSGECPPGTKTFTIENYLLHDSKEGRYDLPTATMTTNGATSASIAATWKIKNACTNEIIAQCLPCPRKSGTTTTLLSRPREPLTVIRTSSNNNHAASSNSNGLTLRHRLHNEEKDEEKDELIEKTTECLPFDADFTLEVLPVAMDSTMEASCCGGFDPATSVISYDGIVIVEASSSSPLSRDYYGALDDNDDDDDERNGIVVHFGKRETPCHSVSPSASPSVGRSAKPFSIPSRIPSDVPSTSPSSSSPTLVPSTSPPTPNPVLFVGGCPESFVPFANSYPVGVRVERNGIVYECVSVSCGGYGFDPGSVEKWSSVLWRGAWEAVGSCEGTLAPTGHPTALPTTTPTKLPSRSPSQGPSNIPTREPTSVPTPIPTPRRRTRTPTKYPTPKPTCSTEDEFNLCLAVDMSGSVCSDGMGSECNECRAAFLPIFFTSECRDKFVSEDTCCNNFANVKEFSSLMVDLLGEFPAEKSFSLVQFATDAQLVSGLSSTSQTLLVIDRLDYTGGFTNHAAAIQKCRGVLPTWDGRKNFIMLITDGVSSEPGLDPEGAAEAAASSAKRDGTFIIPIFISPRNDLSALAFMRRLSSDGKVFDVTDFGSLDRLQDSLVNQVSCS